MPNYRRFRVPGGTYFFTIALQDRSSDLLTRHIELLRVAIRETRRQRPFFINAWTVLPEHMHCVITLPAEDQDYSNRIKGLKIRFSRQIAKMEKRSTTRISRGERGIWQRRFWEHTIKDADDYAHHVDYVHYNPVKHGYVTDTYQWPWSTFHRWVEAGLYPSGWGQTENEDTRIRVGEPNESSRPQ